MLYAALAVVGCLVLVVSPFLPWVTVHDADGDGAMNGLGSLSGILASTGVSSSGVKDGLIVLGLGGVALLLALLALSGETDRRRSLARSVIVLGVICLALLVFDLFNVSSKVSDVSSSGGVSAGIGLGIFVGLLGAIAAIAGSILMRGSLYDY